MNIRETKSDLNVMLDLETCGVDPGCVILTIGACTFDQSKTFYTKINPNDARRYLVEDIETMRWWQKQDVNTRIEAFSGTTELLTALVQFSDWLKDIPNENQTVKIWSKGADFDLPILGHAYKIFALPKPWRPYSGRCYRTLEALLPHVVDKEGNKQKHNALADALYQARCATLMLQML